MKDSNSRTAGRFDLLIRNGEVVLPTGTEVLDVGVKEGKIVALEAGLSGEAGEVVEAAGRLVFPGFIDPHTHMGIPIKNTASADDFASGSRGAACGGVTTILDFTVQPKGQSLREALETRIARAEGKSFVDYGMHVNITDQPEKWLGQLPELVGEGFSSFKVFSTYREAGMMVTWWQFRQILQKVRDSGGLLMLHAEDNEIVERETERNIAAFNVAPVFHTRSRPPQAEAAAIFQAARIAGELDASLYIVHLSSRAGLETARKARERGARLYLETCPQYLLLDESRFLEEEGHYYIATPPLRSVADREALWEAVGDGTIDTIGTDHCPFTRAQKDAGKERFYLTPNGLPGVETMFPLLYTYGVAEGRITLPRLAELLAGNVAEIFGLAPRKGTIRPGADADLVIWNPQAETTIAAENLHGAGDWSPYEGWRVAGRMDYTFRRGEMLVREGEICADTARGELLRNTPG